LEWLLGKVWGYLGMIRKKCEEYRPTSHTYIGNATIDSILALRLHAMQSGLDDYTDQMTQPTMSKQ